MPRQAFQQVNEVRDAFEHLEDRIRERPEDDIAIRPWREGIEFADERISYATLADWLTTVHQLAQRLVDHDALAGERPTVVQIEVPD